MTTIQVAVGVLTDDTGRVLIQRRALNAHQGGLWEFPGGKIESGEVVEAALARELSEELGIEVINTSELVSISHDYGDKQVMLLVHRVLAWRNEPRGVEGQPIAWVAPDELDDFEFPAANVSIVSALKQGS